MITQHQGIVKSIFGLQVPSQLYPMEIFVLQTFYTFINVHRVNGILDRNQVSQIGCMRCYQIAQSDVLCSFFSDERVIFKCKVIAHFCPRSQCKRGSITLDWITDTSTGVVERLVEYVHSGGNSESKTFRPMVYAYRNLVCIVLITGCKAVVGVKNRHIICR